MDTMHASAPAPARPGAATVFVVDDDVAFADALGLAISLTPHLQVTGRAHDAETARDQVLASRPDLLVCDYRLRSSATGVELAQDLRKGGFDAPIVILTGYLAPQVHREADAVPRLVPLSKQSRITELISTFGEVLAGTYRIPLSERFGALSEGELEVLEQINVGAVAAEIARDLHLSIHTVRSRIKSLMRKLEVSSQVEAVAEATRLGLLVPPS